MLVNIGPVKRDFHSTGDTPWPTFRSQFEQAVADSKNLPEKPDNMTLLKIYALYKQASRAATSTASARASPTWSAAPSGTPGTS